MCKVSSSLHFVTLSSGPHDGAAKAQWNPNTDVYSTDNGLVIKVELAGMRSENLEITVEGQRLRISGHRVDGCRGPKCNFLQMAISYGPFETTLDLPSGHDLSQAKAAYVNGFLRIDVPLVQGHGKTSKVFVAKGN